MTNRSITPVRRAAACLVLAGAGLCVAGGGVARATTPADCGAPAHPALYSTTRHEAMPAETHDVKVIDTAFVPGQAGAPELSHPEFAYVDGDGTPEGEDWWASGQTWIIQDAPAYTDYGWLRTIVDRAGIPGTAAVPAVTHEETLVEAAWVETVIDSPHVAAVAEVSHLVTVVDEAAWVETVVHEDGYAYRQKQTGEIKHMDSASWNGEGIEPGKDLGWVRVPDLDSTHVVHHPAVTHQVRVVDTPAAPAIPEVSHVVHHPAVTHTVTVVDMPEVPAVEAVEELSHVETGWTRNAHTSPEGEGWFLTGQESAHEATTHVRHEWVRTVIDVPAVQAGPEVAEVSHMETVVDEPEVPAWDEQVLVSEATPAGPACPTDPVVVDAAVLGESAQVVASAHPAAATGPAAVPTQMLAQTGSDLAVPLGAGLTFVVVGAALVVAGRSRRA